MKKGVLIVVMIATLTGCYQEIPPPPVISFDYTVPGDLDYCVLPCRVNFRNISEHADSFQWDLGDGANSDEIQPTHTYTREGVYKVKLIGKGKGGVNGTTLDVLIKEPAKPVAAFDIVGGGCTVPCVINFVNRSKDATSFAWDFGVSGATSLFQNPSYRYTAAGTYTVKLTASGLGGTSTSATQTVTIVAVPVATTRQYLNLPFANMVLVKGGTFQMGDIRGEGDRDERPVHQVTVSGFYMGQYEVTQRQWQAVMGSNPSLFPGCDDCPVEVVSWDEAQAFLVKLNQQRTAGTPAFRLPTEAEWEYAAGGGAIANRNRFGNGKDVADPREMNINGSAAGKQAYSVTGEYRGRTVKVGSFSANGLGLYDMTGNVMEWCNDWFGSYSTNGANNPNGPSSDPELRRVLRGGSFDDPPVDSRVADRDFGTTSQKGGYAGFRVVASL